MKFLTLAVALVCIPFAFAKPAQPKAGTITVDDNGTKLAYTDSGAPRASSYTTVFAVHGMGFNSGYFLRVQQAAPNASLRFVAVTRRDYAGSTPFSQDELRILNGNATESEMTAFHASLGLELVTFMDNFTKQENISLTPAGGDIAVIGWSLGNIVTVSAIANIKSAPTDTLTRLAPYIRTLILHEPSPNIIGLPNDPRNYVPLSALDPLIPEDHQASMFTEFVAGYFQHGDLSTRNPDVLDFFGHSFALRPPSVYNMAASGHGDIVDFSQSPNNDLPLQLNYGPQLLAAYKTLYSKDLYTTLPNLKNFLFGAEHSASYGPICTWLVQDDDEAHGGGFVKAKLIPGINHMCAWDDAATTLKVYQDAVTRSF